MANGCWPTTATGGRSPKPVVDDSQGFNLAPRAAAGLFPRLKAWVGPYYATRASVFVNA